MPSAPTFTPGGGGSPALISQSGLAANRPAAAAVSPGYLYYATDTNTLSESNGAAWTSVVAAGGGVLSIGGAGTTVLGSQLNTLTAGNAARNILDDGAGNAQVVGHLTTDSIFSNGSSIRLNFGGNPATITQGGFAAANGFGAGSIQAKAANYNMIASDFGVNVTTGAGTIVITLKNNGVGTLQFVKKVDAGAGTVTITPDTGTIDGAATKSLNVQNMGALCSFDGVNWEIIAVNTGVI